MFDELTRETVTLLCQCYNSQQVFQLRSINRSRMISKINKQP